MTDASASLNQEVIPDYNQQSIEEFIEQLNGGFEYAPTVKLGLPAQSPDDPENGDDGEEGDEEDEETPDDNESVTIGENRIPLSDVQRLYEFDQYLRTHPDVAQRVAEAIPAPQSTPTLPTPQTSPPGEGSPPQPPTTSEFVPPTPPESLDLDDPTLKLLWDQSVANAHDAWKLRNELTTVAQSTQTRFQQLDASRAAQDMDIAVQEFRKQYPGLNEDDIPKIGRAGSQFFTQAFQQIGQPVPALVRAMEIAGFADADTRSKMLNPTPTPTHRQKSNTRKQRLNSLSGSPTSAPKTVERPQFSNDRDMVNAIAHELAESMNTN